MLCIHQGIYLHKALEIFNLYSVIRQFSTIFLKKSTVFKDFDYYLAAKMTLSLSPESA